MADLNEKTITQAVIDRFDPSSDPRTREVMSALVRHLHDFAREVRLTEAEWGAAMNFLLRAGQISTPERSEFILTSDTLGLSALVDYINNPTTADATETSLLGPFYIPGSRELDSDADLIGDREGEQMVVEGVVSSAGGGPIAGATLDIWQNAANGLYDVQDPDVEIGDLRARLHTDANGRYRIRTIRPIPYTIPSDGPVGDLLKSLGRLPWRPAHLHVRIEAPGHKQLTTALYDIADPHVETDAVFGARSSLSVPWRRVESDDEASALGVKAPFAKVDFDFVLQQGG